METKRAPDFIGIGGEKTASTWLYTCMLEHPEICGPKEKELCYFDTTKLIGRPAREQSKYALHGLEGYFAYFKDCSSDTKIGEFTVTYLHDVTVAPLLAHLFPNVKIIISLRNPIDRAFSQYNGLREHDRNAYGSFEHALTTEPEFIRRSMYAEYLKVYFAHFKREQIFIALYDDVATEPRTVLRDLFRFLGVRDDFVPQSALHKERSAEHKKLQTLRDKLYTYALVRMLGKLVRILGVAPLLRTFLISRFKKETMSTTTRELLRETFREDIQETGILIGRDLSHWN